jgi:hypothetical protein
MIAVVFVMGGATESVPVMAFHAPRGRVVDSTLIASVTQFAHRAWHIRTDCQRLVLLCGVPSGPCGTSESDGAASPDCRACRACARPISAEVGHLPGTVDTFRSKWLSLPPVRGGRAPTWALAVQRLFVSVRSRRNRETLSKWHCLCENSAAEVRNITPVLTSILTTRLERRANTCCQ